MQRNGRLVITRHLPLQVSSSSTAQLKMILVLGFLTLLVSTHMSSAAVKGGRIVGKNTSPLLALSKGGGGGAVHHTAVVQDPISGAPVVVEKVTSVQGGGIKGAGLGAGSAQYAISDGPFGRRVYRVGASAYPYGLMGSDYYSYPASLYTTPRRVLGRKGIVSNNLSGLSPVGLSSGLKGGVGGGAVHHTTVVQDPLSGAPVVVEKVTNVKGGGIKGAGLGAGSAQYAISDGPFGRQVYRVGASAYPYGLMGSDYYSYPASLYTTPRRVLGRKAIVSNNLSGLSPVGLSSGLKGGVLKDPSLSQFSIGDSQIKTSVFGGRNLYRSGVSTVPYGLMGLDYYSYPRQLLTQRRLSDSFGLGQSKILGGGSLFTAGDSQVTGAIDPTIGQEKVTVVETDPLSGNQRVTTVRRPSGGLKGGQIILSGVQGIGGLRRFKTRPVVQAPVVVAQAPQVISQVKTSAGLIGRSIFGNRAPQLIYVDGGRRFPGIDIIGGSRVGDPRLGYTQLPISTSRFASLGGLSQSSIGAGATLLSPAPLPALASLGKTSLSAKTLSGPLGLTGVGAPTKTITQEEVVGPAGDSQIITTVTKSDGPSKIGGLAVGGPLGLSSIGRSAPATVVQQEEVVNPITGQVSQVTTTQELSQDPIEAAISQAALGDSVISSSPLSQSAVDPLLSGQTQVSVDPFSGSGLSQVRETSYSDPLTGSVTKVTEVSPAGGNVVQQNIADAVVQESISSGIGGGYNLDGYLPRVSLLSQFPYDVPDSQLIRSVVSSPVFQQQQEVEQILVK